jgi:hypothetical protein
MEIKGLYSSVVHAQGSGFDSQYHQKQKNKTKTLPRARSTFTYHNIPSAQGKNKSTTLCGMNKCFLDLAILKLTVSVLWGFHLPATDKAHLAQSLSKHFLNVVSVIHIASNLERRWSCLEQNGRPEDGLRTAAPPSFYRAGHMQFGLSGVNRSLSGRIVFKE